MRSTATSSALRIRHAGVEFEAARVRIFKLELARQKTSALQAETRHLGYGPLQRRPLSLSRVCPRILRDHPANADMSNTIATCTAVPAQLPVSTVARWRPTPYRTLVDRFIDGRNE